MAATTAPGAFSSYCNSMAVVYEKTVTPTTVQAVRKATPEISPPITADSYILDNACGPGVVTGEIKALYPDVHIVAADSSPATLARVRELIVQRP